MSHSASVIPLSELLCRGYPQNSIPVCFLEDAYVMTDPIIHDYYASSVTLYKYDNVPNHEFIVVQFRCLTNDNVGSLRMERTILTGDDGSSAASSRTSLASSSSGVTAKDYLTVYSATDNVLATNTAQLISHIPTDDGERITVADVIAACCVISLKAPEYRLRTKQCYWFAGLVLRLLAGDNAARPQNPNDNSRRAGEVANFLKVIREPELTAQAQALCPEYDAKRRKVVDKGYELEILRLREAVSALHDHVCSPQLTFHQASQPNAS